jgi:hypothetical protein
MLGSKQRINSHRTRKGIAEVYEAPRVSDVRQIVAVPAVPSTASQIDIPARATLPDPTPARNDYAPACDPDSMSTSPSRSRTSDRQRCA